MLTPVEFQQWCRHLQLSATTRELLQTLRASPPARSVRGRGHNVHGSYPSRKMGGRLIPFESHTLELSAIYLLEHDPAVLELYGQPTRLHLRYQNQQGRTIAPRHVPDFLVLRPEGATLEEWKYEQTLLRLAEQYPQRYQRTEAGGWHCPPGEAAAAALGLGYRLRSSAELTPHFIDNLAFLEDYLLDPAPVPEAIRARILARVKAEPGITLAALLAEEAGLRAHEIYALVAQDHLYTDLAATSLTFHWRVALFLDQEAADTHTLLHLPGFPTRRASAMPLALASDTRLLWEGRPWRLVNLGETHTTLLPETGPPMQVPSTFFQQLLEAGTITALTATQEVPAHQEAKERLAQASPADLREANRRFRLVQAYLHHREDLYEGVTTRTLRRWSASFREAQLTCGQGYVGLLPRTRQRGNRLPKAPEAARTKLDTYIAEHFETAGQTPAWAVYVAYQRACEQD